VILRGGYWEGARLRKIKANHIGDNGWRLAARLSVYPHEDDVVGVEDVRGAA
jgi:hypothetical protein